MKNNYYYRSESIEQQVQYRKLHDILKRHDDVLICGENDSIVNNIDKISMDICLDNPDVFYLDVNGFRNQDTSMGITKIYPKYIADIGEVNEYKALIEEEIQAVIELVEYQKLDDYETIKYIYDYFINSITLIDRIEENSNYNSSLGVWRDREASDLGIALAFKQVLERRNIIVTVICGQYKQKEWAWNIIEFNNNLYHVDIASALRQGQFEDIIYDHFMISDEPMNRDHNWSLSVSCTDDRSSYFMKSGKYIMNEKELWEYIDKSCENSAFSIYFQVGFDVNLFELTEKTKRRVTENHILLGRDTKLKAIINEEQKTILIMEGQEAEHKKEVTDVNNDACVEKSTSKISEVNSQCADITIKEGIEKLESAISGNLPEGTKTVLQKIVEDIRIVENMDEVDVEQQELFEKFIMLYLPEIVRIVLIIESKSTKLMLKDNLIINEQFEQILKDFSSNLHSQIFDFYEDKRIELLSSISDVAGELEKEKLIIDKLPYDIDTLIELSSMKEYLDAWNYISKINLPSNVLELVTRIERQLIKLYKTIEAYPDKEYEIQRFKDCYIPDCLRLVSKYYECVRLGVDDISIEIIVSKISESMSTLEQAIIDKLQDIHRMNFIYASAEADALTSIMEQDGYVKSSRRVK